MVIRFTDDIIANTEGSDFIVRKRGPLAIQLIAIFGIAYVAIYLTATIMREMGSQALFIATLTLVISALTWFTLFFSSRHRDLLLATEFQNAILASATQLSTRFCFIVKRDGLIVYVDPGFQKIFPEFLRSTSRTVYDLLRITGLPDDLQETIAEALGSHKTDRMTMTLTDEHGIEIPMIITVEELSRPKNYFLLRGRDYIENRNAADVEGRVATALLLSQALSHLQEGVLVADESFTVRYINPVFEQWLGYDRGEIVALTLTLPRILLHYSGHGSERNSTVTGFSGEAAFACKSGKALALQIFQSPLRDETGMQGISIVARK